MDINYLTFTVTTILAVGDFDKVHNRIKFSVVDTLEYAVIVMTHANSNGKLVYEDEIRDYLIANPLIAEVADTVFCCFPNRASIANDSVVGWWSGFSYNSFWSHPYEGVHVYGRHEKATYDVARSLWGSL